MLLAPSVEQDCSSKLLLDQLFCRLLTVLGSTRIFQYQAIFFNNDLQYKMSSSSANSLNRPDCVHPSSFLRCMSHLLVHPSMFSRLVIILKIAHCKRTWLRYMIRSRSPRRRSPSPRRYRSRSRSPIRKHQSVSKSPERRSTGRREWD
ncbi:uncharacterized protein LOC123537175 isoform X3 [Mercenaria mercenaria]|uniref:uncharacterized protein LOC123537175 isoform X3 n=1 Tax=Mercenaria mercenaria TaxID=6596 RepID=UPI001E1D4236|nr:uncharacterized protein LOC123537175 isoform X3 [Mercenaria mercenaria]